jgi:hypothetical protein
LEARVRQAALKPDFSTTDWAADCAEDPEHDADHHKDSADRVKNRKACEVSNQEKDDAEHNHGRSDPIRYVGFWNCRTSNCQVPQNPNVLSDRPIRRFGHNDVSTAGTTQLTISELAQEANVARGTLNRNIGSVEDLFDRIVADLSADMHRRVAASFAGIDDPAARLCTCQARGDNARRRGLSNAILDRKNGRAAS